MGLHESWLQSTLNSAFAEFSKSFDDLIQKMITEWIQVRISPTGKGLFDFRLWNPEIAMLSAKMTSETTFEVFLDTVLAHFQAHLEETTKIIRSAIRASAKPNANNLLNILQGKIDQLRFQGEKGELMVSLGSARTELQLAFDRVVEWFRPTQTSDAEPFAIEDAISISVDSLKTYYPDFRSVIVISDNMQNFYIQGNLRSFADILFIVFEDEFNGYSKIPGPPIADVDVKLKDNFIMLRIQNSVEKAVITREVHERYDIRSAMHEDRYKQSITTEGGTGFHKIKKILFHDFKHDFKPSLDFGFQGDDCFFVEIAIPFTIRPMRETE